MSARVWFVPVVLLWIAAAGAAAALALRGGERAPPGVFAEAQAREGVLVYAEHCASCHGPDLRGGAAPALRGDPFRAAWSDRSAADLLGYVAGRMPPGRGGSLEPGAYAAATAYLLYRNGYPEGETALALGERAASLELDPAFAPAERGDLAGTLPAREPALLARWFPSLLASVAQEPGDESGDGSGGGSGAESGSSQNPDGSGNDGENEDATADDDGDPDAEGADAQQEEAAGPPPSAAQSEVGDLRVTILPNDAEGRLVDEDGTVRELPGGSRLVAGLAPGSYRLEATWQGRTLAHTLRVEGGAVAAAELVFGLDAALPSTPETIGRPADEPAPPADADAAPPTPDESASDESTPDGSAPDESPSDESGGESAPADPDEGSEGAAEAEDGGSAPPAPDDEAAGSGSDDAAASASDRVPVASAAVVRGAPFGDAVPAGILLDGSELYVIHCLACHGPGGSGVYGPALAGNERLADGDWLLRRILAGGLGMPSFASELSAPEIAAVANWVRSEFGAEEQGPLAAADVRRVREGLNAAQLNPARGAELSAASIGEQRYSQVCSACHGLQGGGGIGPPLAGNPSLGDDQLVITTILYGRGAMPPFALWPDEEIAAMASYIRSSWSNPYAPVTPAEVSAYRPEGGGAEPAEPAGANGATPARPRLRTAATAGREVR